MDRWVVLGSLEWDKAPDVLLPRAKEILKSVGLPTEREDNDNLHVKRDPGSVVLLRIAQPHNVHDIIRRIAAGNFVHLENGKKVWMAIQRSSEENRRLRVMYIAGDMMREIAKNNGKTCGIDVQAHAGQVKIDKILALFRLKEKLVWASKGKSEFSEDERLQIEGFAHQ